MHRLRNMALLTCAVLVLSGCARPQPPPSNVLVRGIVEALMDTGFYAEVGVSRIIGQHHNPAADAWKVFACYQFTLADGGEGADCVDSISALKLDNGSWIVAVTINEIYRWRAISPGQAAGPGRSPEATGSGD